MFGCYCCCFCYDNIDNKLSVITSYLVVWMQDDIDDVMRSAIMDKMEWIGVKLLSANSSPSLG